MKLYFSMMIVLLAIDEGTKVWVRSHILGTDLIPIIPNLIDLTFVENKGVSFSFFSDLPDMIRLPFLIGLPSLVVLWMLYFLIKEQHQMDAFTRWGFVWIIPGAVGNLTDRILFGAVTDFMHFRWYEYSFFVNNFADCFISIGVVLLLIGALFFHQPATDKAQV